MRSWAFLGLPSPAPDCLVHAVQLDVSSPWNVWAESLGIMAGRFWQNNYDQLCYSGEHAVLTYVVGGWRAGGRLASTRDCRDCRGAKGVGCPGGSWCHVAACSTLLCVWLLPPPP